MVRTQEIQTLTFPLTQTFYVWTHLGEGELLPLVAYDYRTGWVGTKCGKKFLVTPQETIYSFDTQGELEAVLRLFRGRLAESRQQKQGAY